MTDVLAMLDDAERQGAWTSPTARRRAEELLDVVSTVEPALLERSKRPAVWAAGALHAAFMELPPPGMSAMESAEWFGVSTASVNAYSLRIRNICAAVTEEAQSLSFATLVQRLGDHVEHRHAAQLPRVPGAARDALLKAVRHARPQLRPDGRFDVRRFISDHDITSADTTRLAAAFQRGAENRWKHERGVQADDDLDGRVVFERLLGNPLHFAHAACSVLEDESLATQTRISVTRCVLSIMVRVFDAGDVRAFPGGLHAVGYLAQHSMLDGDALAAAVLLATSFSDPLRSDLAPRSIRAIWLGLAAEPDTGPDGCLAAAATTVLLARVAGGRNRFRRMLREYTADAAVPVESGRHVLRTLLSGSPIIPGFRANPQIRRTSAAMLVRTATDATVACRELLDIAELRRDANLYRIAAAAFERHGDSLSDDERSDVIARGLRARRAESRIPFHQLAMKWFGEAARENARRDPARRVRTWADSGAMSDAPAAQEGLDVALEGATRRGRGEQLTLL